MYLPNGGATTLDLSDASGSLQLRRYDVTDGTWSDPTTLTGGSVVSRGEPAFDGDVAAVVR